MHPMPHDHMPRVYVPACGHMVTWSIGHWLLLQWSWWSCATRMHVWVYLVPCALYLVHWDWIGDWVGLVIGFDWYWIGYELDWPIRLVHIGTWIGIGIRIGRFRPNSHGHNAGFGHIGHMVHMHMDHTGHVGARSPHRAKVRQPARATGNTVPSHMRPIWA